MVHCETGDIVFCLIKRWAAALILPPTMHVVDVSDDQDGREINKILYWCISRRQFICHEFSLYVCVPRVSTIIVKLHGNGVDYLQFTVHTLCSIKQNVDRF